MTGLSGPVSLRTRALQQHALNGGSYSRPDHALREPASNLETGSRFFYDPLPLLWFSVTAWNLGRLDSVQNRTPFPIEKNGEDTLGQEKRT